MPGEATTSVEVSRRPVGDAIAAVDWGGVEEVHAASKENNRQTWSMDLNPQSFRKCTHGFMNCLMDDFRDCRDVFRCVTTAAADHACPQRHIFHGKFSHLPGQNVVDGVPVQHVRQAGVGLDP